jgi:hypothetical protein
MPSLKIAGVRKVEVRVLFSAPATVLDTPHAVDILNPDTTLED